MGTTQEELQAFYVLALPGFLEYLRTHQSRIEDVELATVLTGIKSMPVTQTIGGVEKTVRVPFALITANVDQAEALAREMAAYALAQGDYAKAQGDRLDIDEVVSNAIAATASANEKATYAQTQGDYAKQQGQNAAAATSEANAAAANANEKAALAASSTLTADALILQQREEIANSQRERQLLDNSLSSVESAVNAAMTAYGLVQNGVNPLAQKPATIYADVPDVLPVGASFMIVPMAMPNGANASVIYQKEGDAVRVKPSGEMVALSAGTVTVWIIPTLNSAAYIEKSVTVRAREVLKQDDDVVLYADDGITYLEI